jgi:hypothetical protein
MTSTGIAWQSLPAISVPAKRRLGIPPKVSVTHETRFTQMVCQHWKQRIQ